MKRDELYVVLIVYRRGEPLEVVRMPFHLLLLNRVVVSNGKREYDVDIAQLRKDP